MDTPLSGLQVYYQNLQEKCQQSRNTGFFNGHCVSKDSINIMSNTIEIINQMIINNEQNLSNLDNSSVLFQHKFETMSKVADGQTLEEVNRTALLHLEALMSLSLPSRLQNKQEPLVSPQADHIRMEKRDINVELSINLFCELLKKKSISIENLLQLEEMINKNSLEPDKPDKSDPQKMEIYTKKMEIYAIIKNAIEDINHALRKVEGKNPSLLEISPLLKAMDLSYDICEPLLGEDSDPVISKFNVLIMGWGDQIDLPPSSSESADGSPDELTNLEVYDFLYAQCTAEIRQNILKQDIIPVAEKIDIDRQKKIGFLKTNNDLTKNILKFIKHWNALTVLFFDKIICGHSFISGHVSSLDICDKAHKNLEDELEYLKSSRSFLKLINELGIDLKEIDIFKKNATTMDVFLAGEILLNKCVNEKFCLEATKQFISENKGKIFSEILACNEKGHTVSESKPFPWESCPDDLEVNVKFISPKSEGHNGGLKPMYVDLKDSEGKEFRLVCKPRNAAMDCAVIETFKSINDLQGGDKSGKQDLPTFWIINPQPTASLDWKYPQGGLKEISLWQCIEGKTFKDQWAEDSAKEGSRQEELSLDGAADQFIKKSESVPGAEKVELLKRLNRADAILTAMKVGDLHSENVMLFVKSGNFLFVFIDLEVIDINGTCLGSKDVEKFPLTAAEKVLINEKFGDDNIIKIPHRHVPLPTADLEKYMAGSLEKLQECAQSLKKRLSKIDPSVKETEILSYLLLCRINGDVPAFEVYEKKLKFK